MSPNYTNVGVTGKKAHCGQGLGLIILFCCQADFGWVEFPTTLHTGFLLEIRV